MRAAPLLLACLLAGCALPRGGRAVAEADSHFPPLVFAPGNREDGEARARYSGALTRLGEPRMYRYTRQDADWAYRLTVVSAWGPTRALRIERRGDRAMLVRSEGSQVIAAGADPAPHPDTVALAAGQADAFAARVVSGGFWTWPTLSDRWGDDGSDWILEGVRDGQYHLVMRWSPESSAEDAGLVALAAELRQMAGVQETD